MYYTRFPVVSGGNIDQELGWAREEFKKIVTKSLTLKNDGRRSQEETSIKLMLRMDDSDDHKTTTM